MGCGASKKPATPEEQQEICKQMAKEMMIICIGPALEKAENIKIKLPSDFDKMKKADEKLRSLANDLRNGKGEEGEKKEEEKGGMLGSMMGMAKKAVDAVQEGGAAAAATALDGVASGLEKAINGIEEPMTDIGKDIVKEKKEELREVLAAHIRNAKVEEAVALCGGPPDRLPNAISTYLLQQAAHSIATELLSVVKGYIDQHKAIKLWDEAINQYNGAVAKVQSVGLSEKLNLEGIKLDIKEHICVETILCFAQIMAETEEMMRGDPNKAFGLCKFHPGVFWKVFQKEKLLVSDYKLITSGNR